MMEFFVRSNRIAIAVSLAVIFSRCPYVQGEKVRYQLCDAASSKACRIMSLDVSPCPEALKGEICRPAKGSHSTTSFAFIPNFSAQELTLQAYGRLAVMFVPDPGQDRDGCKFTRCPIVPGQLYNLTYPYEIGTSDFFIPATYEVKWKLWNTKKPTETCCFITHVTLTKQLRN